MRILALILLPLLLLSGCGDDGDTRHDGQPYPRDLFPPLPDHTIGGCSPATCMGCCQNGACQTGTATMACGYGGIACRPCSGGEECKDGVCSGGSTTCDATSCPDGCCDATGKCQGGGTLQVCGSGGVTCKACDGATEVCLQGTCAPKGTGSYKVILVSATIDNKGCGWETDCDPYVELTVGATTKASTVKDDTNSPVWNEELLSAKEADLAASFSVKVWDEDWGPDDELGTCQLKVGPTELAAGKLVQHCGSYVKDLTFNFQPI